jgi:hypothetical protein
MSRESGPPSHDEGDSDTDDVPADRREPIGEPVVRADPEITGERAAEAVGFDPDDPETVADAAETVRAFADNTAGAEDNVYMLRGAAACAALVRGTGSYKAAAERASGEATVSFIRKWARVHDLPQSVRRHVARGHIAPTAAKHIARVAGEDRLYLAWTTVDADLTVREVRSIASAINAGASAVDALRDHSVAPGRFEVDLPPEHYLQLRRRASLENREPGELVADALDAYFASMSDPEE